MRTQKMRSIISILATAVIACSMSFGMVSKKASAEETTLKPIDLYLIGGQSNAAGYSTFDGFEAETYQNVWYAGQTNKGLCLDSNYVGSDFLQSFNSYRKSVTVGLGTNATRMGPEYGMASILQGYYSEEAPALIFKTAAGGTSLLDNKNNFGNWVPRSLWEQGYTPDIINHSVNNDPTGILYHLFVSNFQKVYTDLVAKGYQPKVKGMAWMQGEADLYTSLDTYETNLKTFITDLRTDLVSITRDNDLLTMPFVIGEIATSFGSYNNSWVPGMITTQRKVAEDMGSSVTTIPTEDLIIVNPDGTFNGVDIYHFAAKDSKTLGQRFANEILRLQDSKHLTTTVEKGKISYQIQGDELTVTLKPDEHHYLDTITLNGQDVKANVTNGVLKVTLTERVNALDVKFAESGKIALTYESSQYASLMLFPKSCYVGETISLRVMPYKGYKVDGVYYNETAMTYNENTKCYETLATVDGVISIKTSTLDGTSTQPPQDDETMGFGCSSTLTGCGVATFVAGAVAMFIKKRKE